MLIKRYYLDKIKDRMEENKILIIYGPRQVGKTTLITEFLKSYSGKVYQSTGENADLRSVLVSESFQKITTFFSGYDLIVIDEAQKISNIGQALKIIVDQIPKIKVIVTGSSSFDLVNKIGEPLVGRQKILNLFPIADLELQQHFGSAYLFENLEKLLVYGNYPEIITTASLELKQEKLVSIRDAYLLKDVLTFVDVKNSSKILQLLKLVAWQIGKEVSMSELADQLEISKNTVEKYLDLLEKSFILKRVFGFSRNLRKEITKTSRFYFYDLGIRNAVISNFNLLENRNDLGELWENFLVMERLKKQEYQKIYANNYFWRTYDQKEIDWVEEREGKLFGYEFKWNSKRKVKEPKLWKETYTEAEFEVVNSDNYFEFIL